MIRKIVAGILVLLVLFLVALIAIPYFFKDQIVEYAKDQLNEQLNAEASFEDIDLSLISSFPDLWIGIEKPVIDGIAPFEKLRLIEADKIGVTVNAMSLLNRDNIIIKGIELVKPSIRLKILQNGSVNWDIAKESVANTETEEEASESSLNLNLEQITISDGSLYYEDLASKMSTKVLGIESNSSGSYSSNIFDLKTSTKVASISSESGKISYLKNATSELTGLISMNMNEGSYTFKEAKGFLNELPLEFKGGASEIAEGYQIDFNVNTPAKDFKSFLSILPNMYTEDFQQIDATGIMKFAAAVKGPLTETRLPGFHVDIDVKDGMMKHPDLALPIESIRLDMEIINVDGQSDNTVLNVPAFHFSIDGQPMVISAIVENPESNPSFDIKAKGSLDLEKAGQAYPLENVSAMQGLVKLDLEAKGTMSNLEEEKYDEVMFEGTASARDIVYQSGDLPGALSIDNTELKFNPQWVSLSETKGKIGQSDFTVSGGLTHFLQYLLKGDDLEGSLQVHSEYFDVNEWMVWQTGPQVETSTEEEWTVFKVPDGIKFKMNASADKVRYDKIDMTNVFGELNVADEAINFTDLRANALQGQMIVNGQYSTAKEGDPEFQFENRLVGIDIKESFEKINTFKLLVPIANLLEGKITTNLSLDGLLNAEMMPQLSSLTGKGVGLLLNGNISELSIIEEIASQLSIPKLEKLKKVNAKTIFKVKDGKVWVEPYEIVKDEMRLLVGGHHGFDQSLDYQVNALLPKGMIGDKATSMMQSMVSAAKKQGVNIDVPDLVKVTFQVGGTVTKPEVKADFGDLFGDLSSGFETAITEAVDSLKELAQEKVEEVVDSAKNAATEIVEEKKQELETKVEEIKDEIQSKAEEKLEEVKKEVEEEIKTEVEEKVKEEIEDKVKDSGVIEDVKEDVGDKAKGALKDLFGKKKKPQ